MGTRLKGGSFIRCKEKILDTRCFFVYYSTGGKSMDKIFEQTLLYDFYGELLTPHQRTVYEDAVYNDMSLSEIAELQGISRQGVHDLIKRCDRILADYEAKLHLVERFTSAKEKIGRIVELTEHEPDAAGMMEIRELSKSILEEL